METAIFFLVLGISFGVYSIGNYLEEILKILKEERRFGK